MGPTSRMRGKQLSLFILTPPLMSPGTRRYQASCSYGTKSSQDQIESFQKMVFSHFRASTKNECRISSLVRLVKESWGIYRFITGMLRAMYRSSCHVSHLLFSYSFPLTGTNHIEALEPLRQRYHTRHYSLRKFYSECSNLKYLTGRVGVPELGPVRHFFFIVFTRLIVAGRNHATYLMMWGPDLPARLTTAAESPTPPPAAPMADEAEEHRCQELEHQQQVEFEQRQREQQDRERLALDASPSRPGSPLPITAAAGTASPTRPQPGPLSSSSHTLHSYPHFPSLSMSRGSLAVECVGGRTIAPSLYHHRRVFGLLPLAGGLLGVTYRSMCIVLGTTFKTIDKSFAERMSVLPSMLSHK